MLPGLLNRLKSKAAGEPSAEEEEAGFRPGRSAVEQIFESRVIKEKHQQHLRGLFHNFIDFKKAFDRVWHTGLWQVLGSFNIEKGLIQAIKALHENSSSAVLLNRLPEEFLKTTVGIR